LVKLTNMNNIVLVGAGKLGSRHLQALAKLNILASIYVIDLNSEALEVAKGRYQEIPDNPNIKEIHFLNSIKAIGSLYIDVAIIATTSEFRRQVIEELIEFSEVRHLILEKILFQKLEDYQFVEELLLKKGIKTWVNFPRRKWSVYQELKESLKDSIISEICVTGQNWSLATSSLHFIDLVAFLTGNKKYSILNLDFNNELYPAYSSVTGSRESKYLEFYGSMKGKFNDSTYFNFTCLKKSNSPFLINIVTDKNIIQIYEEMGIIYISGIGVEKKWDIVSKSFTLPYQSELTNKIVEELIFDGETILTEYKEAAELHLPLLNSFLQFIGSVKNEKIVSCPIT
jgi:predicted dehydrogenase